MHRQRFLYAYEISKSPIPAWLNKKAEAAGINFSQVLQDALKNAIA
jgi:hypothetical protein